MPFDITINPAQTELVAKPGSTITQAYTITNNGSEPVSLTSQISPWQPVGQDGSVDYDHAAPNLHLAFSLGNADLILGQEFTLAPGQKRQLVLKIKSDSTTPQADSYYTFFINQKINQDFTENYSQSGASGRVGSHLLLSYSSTENPKSQFSLSNFTASSKLIDIFYPSIKFTATAYNASPFYSKTSGKFTISKNGLVIKQLDLFPSNVLGGSQREITCLNQDVSEICSITPPYWPGVYTATLTLDPNLSASSISTSFFVFPYSFVVFVSIITSYVFFVKKYIRLSTKIPPKIL